MNDELLRYVRHMQLHAESMCTMRLEGLNRKEALETALQEDREPPSSAEA